MAHTIRPFSNSKNANNVNFGAGDVEIAGSTIGYLSGVVVVEAALEREMVKPSNQTPKKVVAMLPVSFAHKITAETMEMTVSNFVLMFGGDTDNIDTYTGSNQYTDYWTDTLASQQLLTFQKRCFSDWEAIYTDFENIDSSDVPVIKDTTGVTTYTSVNDGGDDYLVDYINGVIWAIPTAQGGDITASQQVRVKYKCTPDAGSYFLFKTANFLSASYAITFTPTDAVTGKQREYYMPSADIVAGGFSANDDGIWLINMEIEAVKSSTETNYPSGYAKFMVEDTTA